MEKKNQPSKINFIHSFTAKEDGTFQENKVTKAQDKAIELIAKFGSKDRAEDVVIEILGTIEHEDNIMYNEIKFWKEVRSEILLAGLFMG